MAKQQSKRKTIFLTAVVHCDDLKLYITPPPPLIRGVEYCRRYKKILLTQFSAYINQFLLCISQFSCNDDWPLRPTYGKWGCNFSSPAPLANLTIWHFVHHRLSNGKWTYVEERPVMCNVYLMYCASGVSGVLCCAVALAGSVWTSSLLRDGKTWEAASQTVVSWLDCSW